MMSSKGKIEHHIPRDATELTISFKKKYTKWETNSRREVLAESVIVMHLIINASYGNSDKWCETNLQR